MTPTREQQFRVAIKRGMLRIARVDYLCRCGRWHGVGYQGESGTSDIEDVSEAAFDRMENAQIFGCNRYLIKLEQASEKRRRQRGERLRNKDGRPRANRKVKHPNKTRETIKPEHFLYLIPSILNTFARRYREELESVAQLALVESAKSFPGGSRDQFKRYAYKSMLYAASRWKRKERGQAKLIEGVRFEAGEPWKRGRFKTTGQIVNGKA